jgi:phage shock protein E
MIETLKKLLGIKPAVNLAELVQEGAIILDVRTKAEFEGGHIRGSVNIPLDKLHANITKLKAKNKAIITCCASGSRSATAKSVLIHNGFSNVHNGGSWFRLRSKISV